MGWGPLVDWAPLILEVPRPSAVRWGAAHPARPGRFPPALPLSVPALSLRLLVLPDERPVPRPAPSLDYLSLRRTLEQFFTLVPPCFCPFFAPSPVGPLVVLRVCIWAFFLFHPSSSTNLCFVVPPSRPFFLCFQVSNTARIPAIVLSGRGPSGSVCSGRDVCLGPAGDGAKP